MKKENAIEFVKSNYKKVEEVLEYGMETGVCDEETLYANGVISKTEYNAIKEEDCDAYDKVMIGLRYAYIQVTMDKKSGVK